MMGSTARPRQETHVLLTAVSAWSPRPRSMTGMAGPMKESQNRRWESATWSYVA